MDSNTVLAIAGAVLVLGYIGSLFLHPYTNCDACKGSGRHYGAVFTWGRRQCHRCAGSGRKQRLGAKIIGRGEPRKSQDRVQPPTRNLR